jgi:hypothetical protein
VAIVQSSDSGTTTPAPPRGHEGPALGGLGSPRGKGRVVGFVVGAIAVVSLVAVALAAGGGHHRPVAAPVVRTSKPRSATPTTAARAVPTTTAPVTSTAVPTSTPPTPTRTSPPAAAPSTISPSVTAGMAVPWSPTSPNTLVGDNGDPMDWPAAQPKPPSLAGAYGDNMLRVIVTLSAYQDWVYAHPNPALVNNYVLFGSSAYPQLLKGVTQLVQRGWHLGPAPREVDWAAVSLAPKPFANRQGRRAATHGHRFYTPAAVAVIFNIKSGHVFDKQGNIVGPLEGSGKTALSLGLSQGTDGRWRIAYIVQLHPTGGFGSLAK